MSMGRTTPDQKGTTVEILVLLTVFVIWIVLQVWVLPRLGVKT